MTNKRLISIFLIMTAALTIFVLGSLMIVNATGARIAGDGAASYQTYSRHYALIETGDDEAFWDSLYDSARSLGQMSDVYVERFGQNLTGDYSRDDLIHMATQAGVDGIIVQGDESDDTVARIDEAQAAGIPVVTVLRDSTASHRIGYVGISGYDVGREYGAQIEDLLPTVRENQAAGDHEIRVVVLIDAERNDSAENLILLGIRETLTADLGEDSGVTVDTEAIDNSRSFSPEEDIRDIFLDEENLPDILICLSAVHTQCAYQAVVDYNKVGEVQILGYYDSETILNAVSKDIVHATMTLDTAQMGSTTVQMLNEYLETGYTNSYTVVDTIWITPEEAQARLDAAESTE